MADLILAAGTPLDLTQFAAWQSSDYSATQGQASLAIDGVRSSDFYQYSCSHTQQGGEIHPWWYTDMQQPRTIRSVLLLNRGGKGPLIISLLNTSINYLFHY